MVESANRGNPPGTREEPPRRPTMVDVARHAHVGLGTVSRVVNGGDGVRASTAERVLAAIAELGFEPNELARALRPGKHSKTLALLVGDLTNIFYASLAAAVVRVAADAGYAVVLSSVDEDPDSEIRTTRELLSRKVAGIIIVPDQRDHSQLAELAGRHIPVVFIDRPPGGLTADTVILDNAAGGKLATAHLLTHGHRRIAHLLAPSYYTAGMRLRGYRRAFREAGVDVDESLIVRLPNGSVTAAEQATRELMARPNPLDAVFAGTNLVAEGTVRALRGTDRAVGLVGFDDFRLADILPTPVTVVASNPTEMGRIATTLLLARVAGDRSPPQQIVLPVHLIDRGSAETGALP